MDYRPNASGSEGKKNFSPVMVTAPKPAASSTSLVRKSERKSKAEKSERFKGRVGSAGKTSDKKDFFGNARGKSGKDKKK